MDSRMTADGLMLTLYMERTARGEDRYPYEVIAGGEESPKGLWLAFFSKDGCAKGISMA